MTALMHAESRRTLKSTFRFATNAVLAVVLWAIASGLVVMAHRTFELVSSPASLVAKITVIALAGFLYAKLAGQCTFDHALFVGVAWLLLSIFTEVAVTTSAHQGWFDLMGAPSKPYSRDLLLIAWVIAPALWARRR